MTTIDIYSGFLGAGKTTLIKKMIREAYQGEQIVLIENEFGEIGIDGGFMQDAGIRVNEMNSGCICCSLVGDFGKALRQVITDYHPDRILIEPSGVGKLSDVIAAVERVATDDVTLGSFITVADATKCKMYLKNFGEFYTNQVETASTVILSRTQNMPQEKLEQAVALLREHNAHAVIITTPWDQLTGAQILEAMRRQHDLTAELAEMIEHEHAHEDGEECDDPECSCHHHHHHADEVFTSWGAETVHSYTEEDIRRILTALDTGDYGAILRAKGIVPSGGKWLHFDYVPEEQDVRYGSADYTGRLCVIGAQLKEDKLKELFSL